MKNSFEEFEHITNIRRRDLLPWWIRFFCWVFMVLGGIACLTVTALLFNETPAISLYGYDATDDYPLNLLLVILSYIFNAVTGFLLWNEYKKAVVWGQLCAAWGIAMCAMAMITAFKAGGFMLRLEILFLILFYSRLTSIKGRWEAATSKGS